MTIWINMSITTEATQTRPFQGRCPRRAGTEGRASSHHIEGRRFASRIARQIAVAGSVAAIAARTAAIVGRRGAEWLSRQCRALSENEWSMGACRVGDCVLIVGGQTGIVEGDIARQEYAKSLRPERWRSFGVGLVVRHADDSLSHIREHDVLVQVVTSHARSASN